MPNPCVTQTIKDYRDFFDDEIRLELEDDLLSWERSGQDPKKIDAIKNKWEYIFKSRKLNDINNLYKLKRIETDFINDVNDLKTGKVGEAGIGESSKPRSFMIVKGIYSDPSIPFKGAANTIMREAYVKVNRDLQILDRILEKHDVRSKRQDLDFVKEIYEVAYTLRKKRKLERKLKRELKGKHSSEVLELANMVNYYLNKSYEIKKSMGFLGKLADYHFHNQLPLREINLQGIVEFKARIKKATNFEKTGILYKDQKGIPISEAEADKAIENLYARLQLDSGNNTGNRTISWASASHLIDFHKDYGKTIDFITMIKDEMTSVYKQKAIHTMFGSVENMFNAVDMRKSLYKKHFPKDDFSVQFKKRDEKGKDYLDDIVTDELFPVYKEPSWWDFWLVHVPQTLVRSGYLVRSVINGFASDLANASIYTVDGRTTNAFTNTFNTLREMGKSFSQYLSKDGRIAIGDELVAYGANRDIGFKAGERIPDTSILANKRMQKAMNLVRGYNQWLFKWGNMLSPYSEIAKHATFKNIRQGLTDNLKVGWNGLSTYYRNKLLFYGIDETDYNNLALIAKQDRYINHTVVDEVKDNAEFKYPKDREEFYSTDLGRSDTKGSRKTRLNKMRLEYQHELKAKVDAFYNGEIDNSIVTPNVRHTKMFNMESDTPVVKQIVRNMNTFLSTAYKAFEVVMLQARLHGHKKMASREFMTYTLGVRLAHHTIMGGMVFTLYDLLRDPESDPWYLDKDGNLDMLKVMQKSIEKGSAFGLASDLMANFTERTDPRNMIGVPNKVTSEIVSLTGEGIADAFSDEQSTAPYKLGKLFTPFMLPGILPLDLAVKALNTAGVIQINSFRQGIKDFLDTHQQEVNKANRNMRLQKINP
jgi:hypothetical protein